MSLGVSVDFDRESIRSLVFMLHMEMATSGGPMRDMDVQWSVWNQSIRDTVAVCVPELVEVTA